MKTADVDQLLDVFFGSIQPGGKARVYARVAADNLDGAWRITGDVSGPHVEGARTLTSFFTLRDLGPGVTALAEATVIDPCSYAPGYPACYLLQISVRHKDQLQGTFERRVGLRQLGLVDGQWRLNGQPWQPQWVRKGEHTVPDWDRWQQQSDLMLELDPTRSEWLEEASRRGVLCAVRLPEPPPAPENIRSLVRWPALAAILCEHPVTNDLMAQGPNLVWLNDAG